jgi:DNA-binding response OmpR family regulator
VLNKEDVDLLLLDVRLPGISGFEVLRIVKRTTA